MRLEDNRKADGPRVLDGVRVLDFTAVIAGPYCTRMMADLGADILKVESPEGDLVRTVEPMLNGYAALFSAVNAGKRSISLDLKQAQAVELIKKLVKTYDVVIENFSPGVMARLGLDYEALAAENSKLIMCSISGYGQAGPDANRPAYAPVVQAWSGYEDVTRRAQGERERPMNMGLPVGDTSASLQAMCAITAALFYRERTGEGQYIDIAMFDTLLGTMAKDFQMSQIVGTPDRIYGPVATADGYVVTTPISPRQFAALVEVIGRPELLDDERFANSETRMRNYHLMPAIIEQWSTQLPSSEVVAKLEAAKVPCAPYRSLGEVAADEQLKYRNMIAEVDHPGAKLKVPNAPFLFSATQAAIKPLVSRRGQHNREVLRDELGLSDDAIDSLERDGIMHRDPRLDTD